MSNISNLRLATERDTAKLLMICSEAHKESPHNLRFDPEKVIESIRHLIREGVIICLTKEEQIIGVLGGLVTMTPMSMELVAAELLWYVLPAQRKSVGALRMLDAFEYWAWSKKCSAVTIGNMTNESEERVDKFYRRKGYRLVEQSYIKGLK